jgi:hypothetical protein
LCQTPVPFSPPCRYTYSAQQQIVAMKVLVGVKRVVDYAVKVRVSNGAVDLANVKQSMNPFCEVRRPSDGGVVSL